MAQRALAVGNQGLSPRVRGNRSTGSMSCSPCGSIPACAGEPVTRTATTSSGWVYPRVCGGTFGAAQWWLWVRGLSPRVRGNRRPCWHGGASKGSIPACAGEPGSASARNHSCRVYPRVCGGTMRQTQLRFAGAGLSPRVRGNPAGGGLVGFRGGSIPACAGEPPPVRRKARSKRVYPRVCGGTVSVDSQRSVAPGLSPRVRGNPRARGPWPPPSGSIPACAGEPTAGAKKVHRRGVYPRVCGGTADYSRLTIPMAGLSPRVRGNRGAAERRRDLGGSIPACAGEPTAGSRSSSPDRVYPRVCGGTTCRAHAAALAAGLSPRVRGNHQAADRPRQAVGSIPACAGEPSPEST